MSIAKTLEAMLDQRPDTDAEMVFLLSPADMKQLDDECLSIGGRRSFAGVDIIVRAGGHRAMLTARSNYEQMQEVERMNVMNTGEMSMFQYYKTRDELNFAIHNMEKDLTTNDEHGKIVHQSPTDERGRCTVTVEDADGVRRSFNTDARVLRDLLTKAAMGDMTTDEQAPYGPPNKHALQLPKNPMAGLFDSEQVLAAVAKGRDKPTHEEIEAVIVIMAMVKAKIRSGELMVVKTARNVGIYFQCSNCNVSIVSDSAYNVCRIGVDEDQLNFCPGCGARITKG